jgi:predicted amidohydrolase YtcJ
MNQQPSDLILHNGKIATQDDRRSLVQAAAIRDGKFLAVEAISTSCATVTSAPS